MPFYVCTSLGTGLGSDPRRPACADYPEGWAVIADDGKIGGEMLCRTNRARFPAADVRIRAPYRRPDFPKGIAGDVDALIVATARRLFLTELLGAIDLPAQPRDLSTLTGGARDALAQRLARWAPGAVDAARTTDELLADVMSRLTLELEPRAAMQGGTFTDNFSGEVSDIDLALHTPSGGTAWTRVDGVVDMAQVDASSAWVITSGIGISNPTFYRCDDQGSADQYVQYVTKGTYTLSGVANRATGWENFIAIRTQSATVQIFKIESGTFSLVAQSDPGIVSINDVMRIESEGNAHTGYLNSVAVAGPYNTSFNAAETGQGIVARDNAARNLLDNFEAGSLSADQFDSILNHSTLLAGLPRPNPGRFL